MMNGVHTAPSLCDLSLPAEPGLLITRALVPTADVIGVEWEAFCKKMISTVPGLDKSSAALNPRNGKKIVFGELQTG